MYELLGIISIITIGALIVYGIYKHLEKKIDNIFVEDYLNTLNDEEEEQ